MKSDWLTASSFERTFDVVSAINTVSIYAKLVLAGVDNPIDPAEVQAARTKLLAFLEAFQILMQETEKDRSGIIVGADPRLSELALQYMAERRRLPPRSRLYTLSSAELGALIQSERAEDMPNLVECLEALRSMMEQFAQADVAGVFGDE